MEIITDYPGLDAIAELPHSLVRDIADEILNLPGVAAVGYDITHKPPGTVEWE